MAAAAAATTSDVPATATPVAGTTNIPAVDQISVDPAVANDFDDGDSAYDSEIASYTTSLATNVTDYKEIAGRRFHAYKEGSYVFPNDEKEQDRLDLTHKMLDIAFNGSWRAPIKDPKRVLDLGTGTGIWALDFADEFPQCDVLGNDLSPTQPRWVPTNVRFEVDDVEATWTYSDKFDLIHSRCLYAAIKDWSRLIGQAFEFTAPGGWVEFVDFQVSIQSPDKSVLPTSSLHKFNSTVCELASKMGCDPNPGPKLETWMKEAGFVDVDVRRCPLPMGTWAKDRHLKEVGAWMYLQTVEGLESFAAYMFTTMLGWSKEEVDVFCAKVRADLKNPKIHGMLEAYSVIGRKPSANADTETVA